MTDPITTSAQMREAAARECDRLGAEFAAEGAPIAKRMMDLASDRIRALPVAEPGHPAVGLLRGAMDAVAITKVAKTISSTITSFDLAWEHQSDQHRSMCMDAAARILPQIEAIPAAQVRAEALRDVLADDEMCLRLAEGYDREDAAQRGEPSPHTMGDEGYAEWAADRIACAKEGLRALIEKEQT